LSLLKVASGDGVQFLISDLDEAVEDGRIALLQRCRREVTCSEIGPSDVIWPGVCHLTLRQTQSRACI
jgi:hypothetical protein